MAKKILTKKGTALILAYSVIAAMLILAGGTSNRALGELRLSRVNDLHTRGIYLAEAGIEQAAFELAFRVANYLAVPADSGKFPPGAPVTATANIDPDYSVTYSWQDLDGGIDQTVTDPRGVVTMARRYKLQATATHTATGISVTLNQISARNITFTFQHAVFYADNLEMLPGPNMTLSGKIHSNKDIYVDTDNTLTIKSDYFYSAGNIHNSRLNQPGFRMPGTVKIHVKDAPATTFQNMETPPGAESTPLDSDSSLWMDATQGALARWNGTVKSSTHEVTALAVPHVASIQPDGYFAANADLKVDDCVITQNGITLIEGVDIPIGTCATQNTFYNNREGKTVTMSEVDMSKLAGGTFAGKTYTNHLPANGLIYATRDNVSSGQEPGIKLIKGSVIKPPTAAVNDGLTVVTNVPVYIQGDYNTGETYTDANGNGKWDTGETYTDANADGAFNPKKPTSVICDSLNLLSNDWSDSNSTKTLSNRPVTKATRFNTAMIAGIKFTDGSQYSGGLENYPRLHENWNGKEMYIRGSFVELWNSTVVNGNWIYGGSQYTAPTRNWDYDTDFNNAGNLPPFTPFAVEMRRLAWWTSRN